MLHSTRETMISLYSFLVFFLFRLYGLCGFGLFKLELNSSVHSVEINQLFQDDDGIYEIPDQMLVFLL